MTSNSAARPSSPTGPVCRWSPTYVTGTLRPAGARAPLVSLLDHLLVIGDEPSRGSLNLGGISNITVAHGASVIAYDIGPANALMDAAVTAQTNGAESFDEDGRRAGRGSVRADLLGRLLAEPYYAAPAPKSTGKELFHATYIDEMLAGFPAVAPVDVVATLTELTAVTVADACRAHRLTELVVGGVGTRNPVLMARIAALVAPCRVRLIDEFGLPSEAKEAYAFAVMGYLTVHELPGTLAGATGAPVGSILGSGAAPGAGWLATAAPGGGNHAPVAW